MKTDKELLELAAKAAGIDGVYVNAWVPYISYAEGEAGSYKKVQWSPLHDDGDALRLAVKLKFDVCQDEDSRVEVWYSDFLSCTELFETDQYAATRRAIVRAAAAIGEKL